MIFRENWSFGRKIHDDLAISAAGASGSRTKVEHSI